MNCQSYLYRGHDPKLVTRRWFFQQCGVGLGAIALAELLRESGVARASASPMADPLAPKQPPFKAKAKRVIYLFMAGAPSHLDLFDYKPELARLSGTLPPPDLLKGYRAAFINPAPSSSARASSSPSTASAAPNCPSCCPTWRRSWTTSPSSAAWSPTPLTTRRARS